MVHTDNPGLLLWHDTVILLESQSDRIWMNNKVADGQEWQLLEQASLGAEFSGDFDVAIVVPDSFAQFCKPL